MRILKKLTPDDLGKAVRLKETSWNEQLAGVLEHQIDYEESLQFWHEWMCTADRHSDCRLLIGMFEDGELLGAAFASIAEVEDISAGGMELNGLWVDARFRYQGIAMQLLKFTVAYYKEYDGSMEKMVVYSHHFAPSNDFYVQLGAKLLRQDHQIDGKLLVDVFLIDFSAIEEKACFGKPYILHSPTQEDIEKIDGALSQYNRNHTGQHEFYPFNFISEVTGEVLGGCNGVITWGWMFIDNLFVVNTKRKCGLGTALLNHALKLAHDKNIKNISVPTIYEDVENYLNRRGFKTDGVLEDRPRGFNYRFMSRAIADKLELQCPKHAVKEVSSDSPLLTDFHRLVQDDKVKQLGDIHFEMIQLSLKNASNNCIGGLLGYIGWDWLYISDLWIDESDRRKGYANALMDYVESYSKGLGVKGSFLGSTDFQSPEFYKKNGYTLFSERKNLPPGYTNYSLKKLFDTPD